MESAAKLASALSEVWECGPTDVATKAGCRFNGSPDDAVGAGHATCFGGLGVAFAVAEKTS